MRKASRGRFGNRGGTEDADRFGQMTHGQPDDIDKFANELLEKNFI